jgi:hypothetical protein
METEDDARDREGKALLGSLAPFSPRNEIAPEKVPRDTSILRQH